MPVWLTDAEHRTLRAVFDRMVPRNGESPGAGEAGAAEYVDLALGAFMFDPPRIWAGGPFSGRNGGEGSFEHWLELAPVEELAWRMRIEGSLGLPEREFNGPVIGWQQRYRAALDVFGADFADVDAESQVDRLAALDDDTRELLFTHACEALYGDPVYGGNADRAAWTAIGFDGDVQPLGWTDDEVRLP